MLTFCWTNLTEIFEHMFFEQNINFEQMVFKQNHNLEQMVFDQKQHFEHKNLL